MTVRVDSDLSRSRTFRCDSTAEWRSVWTARHNVLLEGPAASTAAVLRRLEARLSEPVTWKRPHAPLAPPTGRCGAFVVQDVGALDSEEQSRLLAWLDDLSHRTQVVSTTVAPLFPLVARGLFNATLYYRLNVMLLKLDSMNLVEADAQDDEDTSSNAPPMTTSSLEFA